MDNRIKRLKNIVTLLVVIFALGLAMLVMMIPVHNFFTISVLAVQAVVIIYFAVLSRGLIKDNGEQERALEEERSRSIKQQSK